MSRDQKRVIIMQPGPLHLFWTTGVFYLWSLKDRFDFALIVPETYRDNAQFKKVASLPEIRHVEYLPMNGWLSLCFKYSSQFKQILEKYSPAYILLHNRSYIENQYLIHWARKLCVGAKRYYYQNGRMSLMWQDDFKARRAGKIEELANKYPLFSRNLGLAGRAVDIKNALIFFLTFKVLPYLAIRSFFTPPVNVTNGSIDREATRRMSNADNDCLLSYLDIEIDAYRAQGIENVTKIRHPLTTCGLKVFEFLYGEVVETDSILLLPSYGFTSRMVEAGWEKDSLAQHIAGKWCEAIEKLMEVFPGYAIKMKLHPASFADPLWKNIIYLILSQFSTVDIIDPNQSAEWHVVQSAVIVGDVTTVLWWAGMFGGKVVLSLDIFGYPAGDELKGYSGCIHYLNSLGDIPTLPVYCSVPNFASSLSEVIV